MDTYTTLRLIKIDPERVVKIGTEEYLILDSVDEPIKKTPRKRRPNNSRSDGIDRIGLRNNMTQIIRDNPGIPYRNIVSQLDEQYLSCSKHTFKNALQYLKEDGKIRPEGERIGALWYPMENVD